LKTKGNRRLTAAMYCKILLAASVFPAPLSPEMIMHWLRLLTGRQGETQGGDTKGKGETIGNRRSQGKMSIPVRERPVGIIGNGEDVWGELKGLLSPVELDVLLGVDRNVLEWVHRHNHISNISLKKKKN